MGFSGAVVWWEEWQLRVLVLGSLFLQYFLAFAAIHRRRSIPASLRFAIWLAFLGGDALAIYALATLFTRQKKIAGTAGADDGGSGVSLLLSPLPYNPQGKGGGGGTNGLEVFWAPVLLLHLAGPDSITAYNIEDNELWRRHVVTILSQVTVSIYVFCTSWSGGENDSRLLRAAALLFIAGILKCIEKPMALKSASIYTLITSSPFLYDNVPTNDQDKKSLEAYVRETKGAFASIKAGRPVPELEEAANKQLRIIPMWLFVDLASTLWHRLKVVRVFLSIGSEQAGAGLLQPTLCGTFVRLYTKQSLLLSYLWIKSGRMGLKTAYAYLNRVLAVCLTISAVALFHQSHKQGYNHTDVKVTYTLLWCTAGLEVHALFGRKFDFFSWIHTVAQYNLIASFNRDKNPTKLLKLARCFGCKDYADQHFYVEQCPTSWAITQLVIQQVTAGWKDYIQDVSTYWAFNDRRGQLTIRQEGCDNKLCRTLEAPFDESVLVWHIATDLCWHRAAPEEASHRDAATRSREISNYLVYLLVTNPEMLVAGTRASIFTDARKELRGMFKNEGEGDLFTREIHTTSPNATEAFMPRASKLARQLLALDSDKRWKVLQGVWVEMLCFSASRCRGYLHAKSLGTGGEYLSYVWLLLWFMGLESVAERQQRSDFRKQGEGAAPAPSLSCNETGSSVDNIQGSEIEEEEAAAAPCASGEDNV